MKRIIFTKNINRKYKSFSIGFILFLLLLTIGAAFTLPPYNANAEGSNNADITPQVTQFDKQSDKQKSRPDSKFTGKAKDLISSKHNISKDKLKVANARDAAFEFSGKTAHGVKLIDDKGVIYSTLLDDDGNELDHEKLVKEDLDAKHTKYGKFEPGFFERLSKTPEDQPVKAIISLKLPLYDPVIYPNFTIPDDGHNATKQQYEELDKQSFEKYEQNTVPATNLVLEKLKSKGFEAEGTNGVISVELSPKVLKELQKWDEIESVEDGSIKYTPMLASAGNK